MQAAMKRYSCVALSLLATLALLSRATAADVSLRTMSFNVRYAGTADDLLGANGWFNLSDPLAGRRFKVQSVIEDYAPDILGTQELLDFQYQGLAGQLDDLGLGLYDSYGIGRDDGVSAGEFAAIFYRRDRFTRVDQGTFWLSLTPDVPGSQYPGAGTRRIASWVVLDDRQSRQRLLVLNTHLDNVSNTANQYSASLIRSRLPTLDAGLPTLLTGDLNSGETSSVVRTLLGQSDPLGVQLVDSYRAVFPQRQSNEGTFHGYGGSPFGSRIDFILNSPEFTPVDASIVRTSFDGKYPSDHFPVTAQFRLARVPEPSAAALALSGAALLAAARGYACRRRTRRLHSGCK